MMKTRGSGMIDRFRGGIEKTWGTVVCFRVDVAFLSLKESGQTEYAFVSPIAKKIGDGGLWNWLNWDIYMYALG